MQVSNTHALVKNKSQIFNNSRFMTKQPRKAIMRRSRLENIYNESWQFLYRSSEET